MEFARIVLAFRFELLRLGNDPFAQLETVALAHVEGEFFFSMRAYLLSCQQHVDVECEVRCVQDGSRARWSESLDTKEQMRGRMPKIEEPTYIKQEFP